MVRRCRSNVLAAFIVMLTGCTGESVRVILPARHPVNPTATEVPYVQPDDPFAGAPFPTAPTHHGQPPDHRHKHQPAKEDDEMRMDDMRMDDEQGEEMMHGGHDGHDERKEDQR